MTETLKYTLIYTVIMVMVTLYLTGYLYVCVWMGTRFAAKNDSISTPAYFATALIGLLPFVVYGAYLYATIKIVEQDNELMSDRTKKSNSRQ